jgi:hypothetical protein
MRSKPRDQSMKERTKVEGIKVKDIHKYKELPEYYIGLPDDLNYAIKRMDQIEAKLFVRGYIVVRPLKIFRLIIESNKYADGKKTKEVKREKPTVMMAIELKKDK